MYDEVVVTIQTTLLRNGPIDCPVFLLPPFYTVANTNSVARLAKCRLDATFARD